MVKNLVCGECGGRLQIGFIADHAYGDRMVLRSYWVAGPPEKYPSGWWNQGLERLNTSGKEKHYITAYRCERCGFMKFYAGSDHSGEKQE